MSTVVVRSLDVLLLALASWLAATTHVAMPERLRRHLDGPRPRGAPRRLANLDAACRLATGTALDDWLSSTYDRALASAVAIAVVGVGFGSRALLVLAATLLPLVVVTAAGGVTLRASTLRTALAESWLTELAALQRRIDEGVSLAVVIEDRATQPKPWQRVWRHVTRAVREGDDLTVALEHAAELVGRAYPAASLRLLGTAWSLGTLGPFIAHLERDALASRRASTLERASRREQLVWIPVAIAALVPGVALVVVPLFSSLRTLVGL